MGTRLLITAFIEWTVKFWRLYTRWTQPIAYLARNFIANIALTNATRLPGRNCIDIGAGTAPYRYDLIKHFGLECYTAIDIEPCDATDIIAQADNLPFDNNSIALAVSFDVLQHIFDYDLALNEIARVLKVNGCCLLTLPFLYSECDMHDFHRWTLEGIESEFTSRGFEIVSAVPRGGAFFTLGCFGVWAAQHIVPGQRRGWRSKRNLGAVIRGVLMMVLTLPFTILAWVGLAIDRVFPRSGMYMGTMVYARKIGTFPPAC